MTNREFYAAIAASTNLSAELVEFATAAIAKMDATNEKRKNTPSKTAIANQPLLDRIVDEVLTVEPKTASDVAAVLEISTQKASYLLRHLVADGKAIASDVKVPSKGTQKGYVAADAE